MGARLIAPACALMVWVGAAVAHPGVGIVQDSRGNVFFTDLSQVWRISPDGRKTVAVPKVHTHELFVDSENTLYGEHLWYEGDRTGKWGHRVWQLSAKGELRDVYPAREGFLSDYSFVRDAAGNMYWADRGTATRIRRRAPDGSVTDVISADLGDVRWMSASRDGTVYAGTYRTGGHELLRITPAGKLETVVRKLSDPKFSLFPDDRRHEVMGLAPDKYGNVYVAVAGNRVIKKVAPNGTVTVAARSGVPWSPSGVLPTPRGDLWLLEYNVLNQVRARRILPDGTSKSF